MAALPDNCIDSVVTDSPYHLTSVVKRFGTPNAAPAQHGTDGAFARQSRGFMGKAWDGGDIAFTPELWAQVLRVLKPGGHLAAFGASRGYHRMACAIEDAGFEIRDSLMWIYGSGFPKSHDVALDFEITLCQRIDGEWYYESDGALMRKGEWRHPSAIEWNGHGTALKPAFEPIVLARKPLSEDTVAANVLRWGTGALNIDATRIHTEGSEARAYTSKRLQPGATAIATGEHMGRQEVEFAGMTKDGRWPANVITDGSAEVIAGFPNSKAPPIGSVVKKASAKGAIRSASIGAESRAAGSVMISHGDSGSAARFFYSAKASKTDRASSKHPTVKPIALLQWLARLITPPGGVVFDPFAGSGTTGAACLLEGFRALLVEKESEYVTDICRRITGKGNS